MNPTGLPEPIPADTRAREPFWGYQDLALFLALALPSLVLAAAMVSGVLAVLPSRPVSQAARLLPAQFLGYALWFLFLYLILKLRYGRPFWPSLGWVMPPKGLVRSLLLGPMLALGVAVLGAALQTPEIELPIKGLLTDRFSILLVGVFATTLGPLCEELAFRGFIMPLLMRSLGAAAGIVLTALPFALLHGPQYGWSWRHVLLVTLAGTAFGLARHRTGSTAAAAAMHATYNLTFFVGYLMQGKDLPSTW